jgi:hypothetical protein
MAKYLRLYNTTQEFNTDYNDNEKYFEPWVSLRKDSNTVNYNKIASNDHIIVA